MRFTLPTLILTLIAISVGCDRNRPDDLSQQGSGHISGLDWPGETSPADGDAATVAAPNHQDATGREMGGEFSAAGDATEPVTSGALDQFMVAEEAITPVALPQSSPDRQSVEEESMAQRASEIHAENCLVQYINKVNIPAKAEGTLMELRFEEGDTVNEDDVLAVIDDTAAKLTIELKKAEYKEAMINAANDVNLEDAVNSEELARAEAKAYIELRKEGAIPFWEMEKKRLEAERADLRIELAEMQKKIAEVQMIAKRSELDIADFELTRRQVTAPATGFIEARIAQLGEWVQPGSPLCTLIQMDRLRVEGDINALDYPRAVRRGTPVEVTIDRGKDEPITIKGKKLGFVSMEIDLNNRYRVWVEVENKKIGDDWMIKPGMRADIVIRPSAEMF